MKKVSTLMSLLCLACMGAWAQATYTVASKPIDDACQLTSGVYALSVCSNAYSGFLYYDTGTTDEPFKMKNGESLSSLSADGVVNNTAYLWKIERNGDRFSIQSVSTNEYISNIGAATDYPKFHGNVKKVGQTVNGFTAAACNSFTLGECRTESNITRWIVYQTGNGVYEGKYPYLHTNGSGNPSTLSYWDGGGIASFTSGSAVKVAFYPVTSIHIPGSQQLGGCKFILTNKQHRYKLGHNNTVLCGATDATTIWEFVDAGNGSYYLKNGGYYVKQMPQWHDVECSVTTAVEEAEKCTVEKSGDYYTFKVSSNDATDGQHMYMHGVSWTGPDRTRIVRWDNTAEASKWILTTPETDVTYTYKSEGKNDVAVTVKQACLSDFAAPLVPPFGTVTSIVAEGTVSETHNACTVNYTQDLPFVPGHAYYLGVRLNDEHTMGHYATANGTNASTESTALPSLAKENLWVFEAKEGTFDSFYLKNLNYGYINTASSAASTLDATSKTAMRLGKYTGAKHQEADEDFYLVDATNTNQVFGDHQNSHLGYWNDGQTGNEGSAFRVYNIDLSGLNTATYAETRKGYVTGGFTNDYHDAEAVAAATDAPTEANVKAALTVKQEVIPALAISSDKYYRIVDCLGRYVNAAPSKDISVGTVNSLGIADNGNTTDATSLWKFTTDKHILHANSSYYMGGLVKGSQVSLTTAPLVASRFDIAEVAGEHYRHTIKASNGLYLNTNETIQRVDGWDGDGDGSRWYIVEAESVPVKVGTAGYTTVCLPMAVTIPEAVTAYKATSESTNNIILSPVTGSVAANTPLIIEAAQGTYDFAIATEASTVEGNILSGTTARCTGFGEDSFYALAADSNASLGVSFKLNGTVDAIPANKAYLLVSNPAVQALCLNFSEAPTTGIESTTLLPNAGTLYNLEGQPVHQATRGIYVKANGQKVFILK